MSMISIVTINVMVFVGVLLIIFGGAHALGIVGGDVNQVIKRRLQTLTSGADPKEVLRLLRRSQESEGFGRIPLLRHWPVLVRQAGLAQSSEQLLLGLLVLTCLLVVMLVPLVGWVLAATMATALGVVLPVGLLCIRRSRRRYQLSKQLPDAIDLMVQSLRAGHPINPAFYMIAREMPDPLGGELAIVADAISYGDDLTTAIEDMAGRIAMEDFNYLAVAITIQHSTGGNLATVLESLSRVIRGRFAMERKIKALSAEGRITAIVVSIVPVAIALFLHLTTPNYYTDVADDPLFAPLLGLGVLLTILNAIVLRRLVRFHV